MANRRANPYKNSLVGYCRGNHGDAYQLAPVEEIPANKSDAQGAFASVGLAAAKFTNALRGSDTVWDTTTAAKVLIGAMAGVTLSANGSFYTTPELRDMAHFSGCTEEGHTFQVNALIQKTFDTAGLTDDDISLEPNTMEAAELTAVLSSLMAGIYFTHIANIDGVRNSLFASLCIIG